MKTTNFCKVANARLQEMKAHLEELCKDYKRKKNKEL